MTCPDLPEETRQDAQISPSPRELREIFLEACRVLDTLQQCDTRQERFRSTPQQIGDIHLSSTSWLHDVSTPVSSGGPGTLRDLGREVSDVMGLIAPRAQHAGIQIRLNMPADLAGEPAGIVGSFLMASLTRAVSSCRLRRVSGRRIDISLHRDEGGGMLVHVADNGKELVGYAGDLHVDEPMLQACRQLVESCEGELTCLNIPYGRGVVLRAVLPVSGVDSTDATSAQGDE